MNSNEEEVRKEPLLPSAVNNKKLKSARFQVTQAGEKKGEDEGDKLTEDSGLTHQGSHQFTQYAKSFRHYLTRDVLPSEQNYRNLLSFSRSSQQKRPTMQELRDEEAALNKEVRSRFYIRKSLLSSLDRDLCLQICMCKVSGCPVYIEGVLYICKCI